MKKYFIFVCFLSIVWTIPFCRAHAALVINEVMYDLPGTDTDHEWVELYNNGGSAVDITGYKFNDGSNHTLNVPPQNGGQGTLSISAGGYLILSGDAATFIADHPGFVASVIDTVMSLGNTSDTLSLLDGSGVTVDTFSYTSDQGAAGDGNSLSRDGTGAWSGKTATPGTENSTEESATGDSTGGDTSGSTGGTAGTAGTTGSTSGTQTTTTKEIVPPHFILDIKTKTTTAFVGVPVSFEEKIIGLVGEPIGYGKVSISFGDGSTVERTTLEPFAHIYEVPGEYVFYAEYYQNPFWFGLDPDATRRFVIKVVDPGILVSSVSDTGNVELSNTASYEINLASWQLSKGNTQFTFPKNTFLVGGRKMTFLSKITGFSRSAQTETVSLLNPSGVVVSQFPKKVISTITKSTTTSVKSISVVSKDTTKTPIALAANVLASQTENKQSSKLLLYVFFGVLLVLVSAISIYVYRAQKKPQLSSHDEELASGIEIIDGMEEEEV